VSAIHSRASRRHGPADREPRKEIDAMDDIVAWALGLPLLAVLLFFLVF
jgi:hypothetical protein